MLRPLLHLILEYTNNSSMIHTSPDPQNSECKGKGMKVWMISDEVDTTPSQKRERRSWAGNQQDSWLFTVPRVNWSNVASAAWATPWNRLPLGEIAFVGGCLIFFDNPSRQRVWKTERQVRWWSIEMNVLLTEVISIHRRLGPAITLGKLVGSLFQLPSVPSLDPNSGWIQKKEEEEER